MANAFSVTPTVAEGMLNGTGLAEALGASPKIRIYNGAAPANAAAALVSNTQLGELVMAATPFSSFTDTGTAARATAAAIASDVSADATGTATFFRILNNAGTTVIAQGSVGIATADLILNTVSITAGSTISITSATIDLPYGP
jgi:hypothetical protein